MKLKISHEIVYGYEQNVYLEPHKLYLLPRLDENIICDDYQLILEPKPHILAKNTDVEGNRQWICFFKEPINQLKILSEFTVENKNENPFEFVFYPYERNTLPMVYTANEQEILKAYLHDGNQNPLVENFAKNIAKEVDWQTTKFLLGLCQNINLNFKYEIRETGAAFSPEKTLTEKTGSCRDFSVLFVACCHALGIAARFVSGYLYAPSLSTHYLHAWVEVYLPGGGWRGFDPTQNKAISQQHIALAASAFPLDINPVIGSYIGPANSIMNTTLNITKVE